jgi:hypothetical protein
MKKIIYLFLLSANLINAQIALEQTYTNQGDYITNYQSFDFDVTYTQSGIKYVTYNRVNTSPTSTTTEIKIYNEDHSLFKTINCPNLVRVYSITDKLFNNDDNLEILYQSSRYLGLNANYYTYVQDIVLVNENETVLWQANDRIGAKLYKTSTGVYKLIIHSYNNNAIYYGMPPNHGQENSINGETSNASTGAGYITTPYSFEVYGLSGTLSTQQEQVYLKNDMVGFPVPTEENLNISNKLPLEQNSKLEIYDINGKKVLEKDVASGTKDFSIDVSNLSAGTYIYKLNGISSKFIKE